MAGWQGPSLLRLVLSLEPEQRRQLIELVPQVKEGEGVGGREKEEGERAKGEEALRHVHRMGSLS